MSDTEDLIKPLRDAALEIDRVLLGALLGSGRLQQYRELMMGAATGLETLNERVTGINGSALEGEFALVTEALKELGREHGIEKAAEKIADDIDDIIASLS